MIETESVPPEGGTSPFWVNRPAEGEVRVRMDLAYVGSGFRGFADNEGVRTVAGELLGALDRVFGRRVELAVAGRTDAGVHARSQVVSFDAPVERFDPVAVLKSLNSMLAPEIAVSSVEAVDDGFHARYSATGRTYRYQILNAEIPDPFLAGRVWQVRNPLDLPAMEEAAKLYLGTHDFTGFCRQAKNNPHATMVRRVESAFWSTEPHGEGRLLTFEVSASAFCHQMVRSLVGALVEVGFAHRSQTDIAAALVATQRAFDGRIAPPEGLTLWSIRY